MPPNPPRHSFVALDGLRGLAAVAVLVYHAHDLIGPAQYLPRAYLAVDLFFLLSGFVISHAYHDRLTARLSISAFMRMRFERLSPTYLVGAMIALVAFAIAMTQGSHIMPSVSALLSSLALGLLFLPTPSSLSGSGALYPLNPAAWSIFFELVGNLMFAAMFAVLRAPVLCALIILGASTLMLQGMVFGTVDLGVDWQTFWGGPSRITFSFFTGAALHRLHRDGRLLLKAPSWLTFGAVMATFAAPSSFANPLALELVCVFLVYPIVVASVANHEVAPWLCKPLALLGAWSYPLYILHTPLLFLLTGTLVRLAGLPVDAMRPWGGIVVIALIFVVVVTGERWFERPILAFLRGRRRGVEAEGASVGRQPISAGRSDVVQAGDAS